MYCHCLMITVHNQIKCHCIPKKKQKKHKFVLFHSHDNVNTFWSARGV